MKQLIQLLITAAIISGCQIAPPKPVICVHVQEDGYFRCKDTKTNERFDKAYEDMPRWFSISPDDYNDIIDYMDRLLHRSGARNATKGQ